MAFSRMAKLQLPLTGILIGYNMLPISWTKLNSKKRLNSKKGLRKMLRLSEVLTSWRHWQVALLMIRLPRGLILYYLLWTFLDIIIDPCTCRLEIYFVLIEFDHWRVWPWTLTPVNIDCSLIFSEYAVAYILKLILAIPFCVITLVSIRLSPTEGADASASFERWAL